jgi:hypothetical protein
VLFTPLAQARAASKRVRARDPAAPGTIEVYELAIDSHQQSSDPHLPGVRECLIVTRGAVRAGPADRPADLAAGDSIHHDAAQPHIYQGLEPENHALLLMIYPR